jgi:hypothetical protein
VGSSPIASTKIPDERFDPRTEFRSVSSCRRKPGARRRPLGVSAPSRAESDTSVTTRRSEGPDQGRGPMRPLLRLRNTPLRHEFAAAIRRSGLSRRSERREASCWARR